MWVITVFDKKDVRIFEYSSKNEATEAMSKFKKNAVLTYTKQVLQTCSPLFLEGCFLMNNY